MVHSIPGRDFRNHEVKRFSETLKWDDPWFQQLPGHQKLIFLYVIDRCDNAGFLEINEAVLLMHTGLNHKHLEGAWEGLARGLKLADGWVWVRTFLKNQKNTPPNPNNPAHRQIARLIEAQCVRFSKVLEFNDLKAPWQGLSSPLGTGIGKGKKGDWGKQRFKHSRNGTRKTADQLIPGVDYELPEFLRD